MTLLGPWSGVVAVFDVGRSRSKPLAVKRWSLGQRLEISMVVSALRRSPLFPFPSHLATFPSRGCARLELEKAATENRQM